MTERERLAKLRRRVEAEARARRQARPAPLCERFEQAEDERHDDDGAEETMLDTLEVPRGVRYRARRRFSP